MRKFNFRESQTLDFQFWDKYGAVSYTEILYMIQSNRVENASNASMPLYTTQSIFVYRGTQVYNLHIVQWKDTDTRGMRGDGSMECVAPDISIKVYLETRNH